MQEHSLSPDCRRILGLPRRNWREVGEANVDRLTRALRTSSGTQTLRVLQAAGLVEAVKLGGLFVHGRVGCGKTLLSALLGVVLNRNNDPHFRIVIVVPGSLRKKTEDELTELRRHWKIPRTIKVITYSMLARSERRKWLHDYKPDVLICDEGDALKSIETSAAAIRVQRFLRQNPACFFCVMSGTLSPHGKIGDYAHLLYWSLRQRTPLPIDRSELLRWQRALDGTGDSRRMFGAKTRKAAGEIYKARLAETEGVIISDDQFTAVPLRVRPIIVDASEAMRDHYERLRDLWEMPDGWSLGDDQFQVAAAARQFANGFSYRLEPRPSEEFLKRRKAWANVSRKMVENGICDSEGEAKALVRLGKTDERTERILSRWEAAERSHPMRHVADWHCGAAIKFVKAWIEQFPERGIVWVKHIEFGEALEQATGAMFFRGQGDRDIRREKGDRTVIASIDANAKGKNLQAFRLNLIMDPPANGLAWEQLLGRSHRENQTHPVRAWYYVSCREHRTALEKAIRAAQEITATLSPQKLSILPPPPDTDQNHPAWFQAQKADDQ